MLHVFYHIAAMNNWQDVVLEQTNLLSVPDDHILNVSVGYDGEDNSDLGILLNGPFNIGETVGSPLSQYEFPAMRMISQQRNEMDDDDLVLYFHTKGVSKPNDLRTTKWRELMNMAMLEYLPHRIHEITPAKHIDAVGVGWSDMYRSIHHFSGNFWLARASYIKELPDFDEYNKIKRVNFEGGDADYRFNAEFWIGSANPIVISQYLRNTHYPWYDRESWDKQINKFRLYEKSFRI